MILDNLLTYYFFGIITIITLFKFHKNVYFKLKHHDFLKIIDTLTFFKEGNPDFDEIYRKSIKFIRELELVNFGLNM